MKDQSKKIKYLIENSNAIFESVFNRQKKVEKGTLNSQGMLYDDDVISITSEYKVLFKKTGSFILDVSSNWGSFTHKNWVADGLSWIAESKFKVESVDIEKNSVSRFVKGRWDDGYFKGEFFINSEFNGGFFNGKRFINSNWNISPFNFINGTIKENGKILGLNDIADLNQNKFKFNIIAVVQGRMITIKMKNGVSHEITVKKRLDENSSNFLYKVKNGNTQETKDIQVKWGILRGNSQSDFENMTSFSNNKIPDLFTNIFNLQFKSPIVKVIISESGNYEKEVEWSPEKKSQEELATSQESYDLNKVPFLGIKEIIGQPIKVKGLNGLRKNTIGRVFFNFPTTQHHEIFKSVIKALDKGYVKSYFTQIRSAIENNVISGAPDKYPYLANIIGTDNNLNIENLNENLAISLEWANKFLQNFVDTIVLRVTKNGKQYDIPNTKIKEKIKNNLKIYLGIQNTKEKQTNQQISNVNKNQTKPEKLNIPENYTIRNLVRKIISNNMKHY